MSTARSSSCASGPKHKWAHVRDVTIENMTIGPRGTTVRISVRGEYKCACGSVKHGQPKGGL